MNSPAVEQLQRIAKSGDVAAMTALGIRLMTGRDAPMSPFDGAQLITDAAAKGDAQAAGIVAVLAGAGACMPQNWPLAFDYLQLAGGARLNARGQRVTTLLIYLNEGYEAGETEFPLVNIRYKGRKGGALLFRNVEPSGIPDRQTLHAGLAPTRGEKWLLSQWMRDKS